MNIHYKTLLRKMGVESVTHLTMHNVYYIILFPGQLKFAWLSKLQAVMTALRTDIGSIKRDPMRRTDIAHLQSSQRYCMYVQQLANSP